MHPNKFLWRCWPLHVKKRCGFEIALHCFDTYFYQDKRVCGAMHIMKHLPQRMQKRAWALLRMGAVAHGRVYCKLTRICEHHIKIKYVCAFANSHESFVLRRHRQELLDIRTKTRQSIRERFWSKLRFEILREGRHLSGQAG